MKVFKSRKMSVKVKLCNLNSVFQAEMTQKSELYTIISQRFLKKNKVNFLLKL